MVLGVYISNSGIRAAYLDQDGNPVQISLSAQSPKFVLKPSIFLEGEFAYTGEYVEKMLYLNPGLEHFSDLITELEKE